MDWNEYMSYTVKYFNNGKKKKKTPPTPSTPSVYSKDENAKEFFYICIHFQVIRHVNSTHMKRRTKIRSFFFHIHYITYTSMVYESNLFCKVVKQVCNTILSVGTTVLLENGLVLKSDTKYLFFFRNSSGSLCPDPDRTLSLDKYNEILNTS